MFLLVRGSIRACMVEMWCMLKQIISLQPLEAIFKKDLGSAPKRLQKMLLRLQRYNHDVTYQKRSLMLMSDPLSRAYLNEPPTETEHCNELEEIVLVEDLPISEAD